MSISVAGPNAASQRSSRAARASGAAIRGMPSGSHSSMDTQRYCVLVHRPLGRPRTIRCSVDSRNSTRVDSPTNPSHFLPSPNSSCSRSSGTAFESSAPVRPPLPSRAATVLASARRSQPAPSSAMPWDSISATSFRRSVTASASVHAAWTTGTRSRGTTNIVRRMHRVRTNVRRS